MVGRIVFIVSFIVTFVAAFGVSLSIALDLRAYTFGISAGDIVIGLIASLLFTSVTLGGVMTLFNRSMRTFMILAVGVAVCTTVLANLWCYADERSFLLEATRSPDYATRKIYARARRFPHRSSGLVLNNGNPSAHD
jgi:hypothetical protein